MDSFTVVWDWLTFAVRWAHIVAGIGWIGTSFYFIALDLGLRKSPTLPPGTQGEEWQVHGGGFYHVRKFTVAPPDLPEHLTWYKWEAYATWLSGFALLCVMYYVGADLYLIDPTVLDMPAWAAILVSMASIGIGWVLYDLLCKSPLGTDNTRLMIGLYVVLVVMAWGYTQVFSGRAALLHLGAFTATIMTANVFFIIIPNQRKIVTALKAGEPPDPALGAMGKQRSVHNNYLTLPVLFLMVSNHYPLAFATEYNWIIASLVFLIGVCIRHYFNTLHAGKGHQLWTWLLAVAIFGVIIWLSTFTSRPTQDASSIQLTPQETRLVKADGFDDIRNTVLGRCAMCHAQEPFWEGIAIAPKGVVLETDAQIARHAREIYLQAGRSTAMPPGNITFIEWSERQWIVDWYERAAEGS